MAIPINKSQNLKLYMYTPGKILRTPDKIIKRKMKYWLSINALSN